MNRGTGANTGVSFQIAQHKDLLAVHNCVYLVHRVT